MLKTHKIRSFILCLYVCLYVCVSKKRPRRKYTEFIIRVTFGEGKEIRIRVPVKDIFSFIYFMLVLLLMICSGDWESRGPAFCCRKKAVESFFFVCFLLFFLVKSLPSPNISHNFLVARASQRSREPGFFHFLRLPAQ